MKPERKFVDNSIWLLTLNYQVKQDEFGYYEGHDNFVFKFLQFYNPPQYRDQRLAERLTSSYARTKFYGDVLCLKDHSLL